MGFRIRQSFNLGGGFRITLSKSGIGYSWGGSGFRFTRTAQGRNRRTIFIPGTGISHVVESRGRAGHPAPLRQQQPAMGSNVYDTQDIENIDASALVSEGMEDMLAAARRAILYDKLSIMGMLLFFVLGFLHPAGFILSAACLALKIYVRVKGVIHIEYDIDEDQQAFVNERLNPMIWMTKSAKVWRIMQTSKVIDKKYTSGAGSLINRTECTTTTQMPFPFKANVQVASFSSGEETLIFLPDRLFIIQGSRMGILDYSDIRFSTDTTNFVESEGAPKDAEIVDHTWRYVNKSGGPDKRFKDNAQLPICKYGKLRLTSRGGLNTVLMYSKANLRQLLEHSSFFKESR